MLGLAAENGHTDVVRLLMEGSNKKNINEALLSAVSKGQYECAKELVASVSCRTTKRDALTEAARKGHLDCLELLIPLSDPRARDSEALRYAAMNQCTQCIHALIDVSDSRKVLSELQRVFYHKPDIWLLLAEIVESKEQRATLTAAIALRRADNNEAPVCVKKI